MDSHNGLVDRRTFIIKLSATIAHYIFRIINII